MDVFNKFKLRSKKTLFFLLDFLLANKLEINRRVMKTITGDFMNVVHL